MKLTTYWNKSPDNAVKKSLSKISTYSNVTFHASGAFSIVNPEIIISGEAGLGQIKNVNYCHFDVVDRYYYITDISTDNNRIIFKCKCDPLMSYKEDILASKQYVIRQENRYLNPYLQDNELPIRSDHGYLMKEFGNPVGLTSGANGCTHVILATTGEGGHQA